MTYTAFTYKVEEVETFGLFPNSADCSINFGFYIPENKSLVLRSKDKNQELKSYQKSRAKFMKKGKHFKKVRRQAGE